MKKHRHIPLTHGHATLIGKKAKTDKELLAALNELSNLAFANAFDLTFGICHCLNWHPSVKENMGKNAVCSYCKKPRYI